MMLLRLLLAMFILLVSLLTLTLFLFTGLLFFTTFVFFCFDFLLEETYHGEFLLLVQVLQVVDVHLTELVHRRGALENIFLFFILRHGLVEDCF